MRDNRLGKFTLFREGIDNYPDNVKLVMKEVIVVRAEYMFDRDCIEYVAICDQFHPVPEACYAPEYKVSIESEGDVNLPFHHMNRKAIFTRKY